MTSRRRRLRLFPQALVFVVLVVPGGAAAAAGDLDPTFGDGGIVLTDIGTSTADAAVGIAIQPNGKIVLSGERRSTGEPDFALVRYVPG